MKKTTNDFGLPVDFMIDDIRKLISRCAIFRVICKDERDTAYLSTGKTWFVGWSVFFIGVKPKKAFAEQRTSGPRSMCRLMAPTEWRSSDNAVLLVRQFG